uniref:Uncharacterized protein n=1 Tax=Populus trichocarpa TaxID=3694 RepID=A0A3N7FLU3_POPTR
MSSCNSKSFSCCKILCWEVSITCIGRVLLVILIHAISDD